MAKRTKKRAARSTSPARRRSGAGSQKAASPKSATRSGTKQARAIEMLRSKGGASLAALMSATGWQQHSVRGFLAGVVLRRLKQEHNTTNKNNKRTYRITSEPVAPSSKDQGALS